MVAFIEGDEVIVTIAGVEVRGTVSTVYKPSGTISITLDDVGILYIYKEDADAKVRLAHRAWAVGDKITTAEEILTLPPNTVFVDSSDHVLQYDELFGDDNTIWEFGDIYSHDNTYPNLPAFILHIPKEF